MGSPNVLWIGGPAGAGKTTTARLLARRHGLRWYNADTMTWEHRDRAVAAGLEVAPRGPGVRRRDRMPMILDDLHSLPASPLIVAEGGLTTSVAEPASRAVWLMPSKEVQLARLRIRHPEGIPPGYLTSWDRTVNDLDKTAIATITVDHLTVDETIGEVERVFAPYLAKGPTATSPAERRELIRCGNQAIVAQHTRFPSGRTSTRIFDCECAASSCDAFVDLRVRDAEAAVRDAPPAILATGH
jgi:hypothetical protein